MFAFFSLFLFAPKTETPVRATLGDGQILMGQVRTKTLRLESGSGILDVPLADVGEVVPAAAGGLGESEGQVDVWLRNGSELRGRWADPKLAMGILVGGAEVPVDLPMNDLSRFQLQGGAQWPGGPVYRMRTRWGDDFLVDPARTHLVLQNEFGTFAPLLSECRMVAPVGEAKGLWRIELETGTVLLGHLQDDVVTVALPMGPEEVSVPLDQFVSLRIESWSPVAYAPAVPEAPAERDVAVQYGAGGGVDGGGYAIEEAYPVETARAAPGRAPATVRPAPAADRSDDAWFDNGALQATKQAQQ